jgi:hypothetical protein
VGAARTLLRTGPMGSLALRVLVLVLALAQPLVAWLVQSRVLGPTIGEHLEHHPALFVPAPPTLAIAVPIFGLDLACAVVQATGWRRDDPRFDRLAMPVAVAFAATSAWMIVFPRDSFLIGIALVAVVVAALGIAAARAQGDHHGRTAVGRLLRAALGLHLGFASVLVLALVHHAAEAYGWSGFGLDQRFWAYAAVALGGFLAGGAVGALRGNIGYAAGAITGFVGIALAQWTGPREGTAPTLGTAAMVAAVLVAMSSLVAVAKRASDHEHWVRRGKRNSSRASLP